MTREELLRDPELAPYARRELFERLTAGLLDRAEAMTMARRLDMDLQARCYAIALVTLPPPPRKAADYLSDPAAAVRSGLMAHFLKYSEYVAIPWGMTACAVLLKGDEGGMPALTRRCVDQVREQYESHGLAHWCAAVSGPVDRLEDLPGCWEEVSRLWAMQYVRPEEHVFLAGAALPESGESVPGAELEPPETAHGGPLGRATAYIREALGDPALSLAEAAEQAGVSAGYLSALFRKELGVTFTEYVTARRMERAKSLLRNTDMPVGQAAHEAGFGDARYFSTLFKKTQGCTPTQFREGIYNV